MTKADPDTPEEGGRVKYDLKDRNGIGVCDSAHRVGVEVLLFGVCRERYMPWGRLHGIHRGQVDGLQLSEHERRKVPICTWDRSVAILRRMSKYRHALRSVHDSEGGARTLAITRSAICRQ